MTSSNHILCFHCWLRYHHLKLHSVNSHLPDRNCLEFHFVYPFISSSKAPVELGFDSTVSTYSVCQIFYRCFTETLTLIWFLVKQSWLISFFLSMPCLWPRDFGTFSALRFVPQRWWDQTPHVLKLLFFYCQRMGGGDCRYETFFSKIPELISRFVFVKVFNNTNISNDEGPWKERRGFNTV